MKSGRVFYGLPIVELNSVGMSGGDVMAPRKNVENSVENAVENWEGVGSVILEYKKAVAEAAYRQLLYRLEHCDTEISASIASQIAHMVKELGLV